MRDFIMKAFVYIGIFSILMGSLLLSQGQTVGSYGAVGIVVLYVVGIMIPDDEKENTTKSYKSYPYSTWLERGVLRITFREADTVYYEEVENEALLSYDHYTDELVEVHIINVENFDMALIREKVTTKNYRTINIMLDSLEKERE